MSTQIKYDIPPSRRQKILDALAEVNCIVDSSTIESSFCIPARPATATELFRNRRTGRVLASLTRIKKVPQ